MTVGCFANKNGNIMVYRMKKTRLQWDKKSELEYENGSV